ncbi:hypothetical protein [Streptomyces flavofungini]|uniref:hypothetical protein n=1 Tax=Streptomyces flavofungini TaxID=68200 RepID=UPI0034DE43AD
MIKHTLLVQFTETIPDADLDQYLADVEKATRGDLFASARIEEVFQAWRAR